MAYRVSCAVLSPDQRRPYSFAEQVHDVRDRCAGLSPRRRDLLGDPLHCAGPYAMKRGDLVHSKRAALEGLRYSLLDLRGRLWAAKRLAFAPRPRKPRVHSLADHGPLKLCEHAHHLEHGLASR